MVETAGPGAVLAVDYGARRIGLAVSDPHGVFAFPAGILERSGPEHDLAALREIVERRGVVQIVVGLPIHMNGREGPEARAARAFAAALGRETGRTVHLFDERWTSREAERALRESERRREPGDVDAVAATLLLRAWLERRARGAEGER
jgi:putative Holliday junction resolvase